MKTLQQIGLLFLVVYAFQSCTQSLAVESSSKSEARKNIIFILSDDHRYDSCLVTIEFIYFIYVCKSTT